MRRHLRSLLRRVALLGMIAGTGVALASASVVRSSRAADMDASWPTGGMDASWPTGGMQWGLATLLAAVVVGMAAETETLDG